MATLTETSVSVSVTVARDEDGTPHAYVRAVSLDASGDPIRQLHNIDVYPLLGAVGQQRVTDLLDAVVARVKTYWSIP